MSENMSPVLLTFIGPLVGCFFGSFFGYLFGKRKIINELRLNKAFPIAEEIAVLVQETYECEQSLISFYNSNFSHLPKIEAGVAYMEERPVLYRDIYATVEIYRKKLDNLCREIRRSRIYLNDKSLDKIEEYWSIGDIRYDTDCIGGSSYLVEFFKNILDEDNLKIRKILFKKIKKSFTKLHNI